MPLTGCRCARLPTRWNSIRFSTRKVAGRCGKAGLSQRLPLRVARGKMATSSLLDDIGRSHGNLGTQVGLRWTLQKGVAINAMPTRAETPRVEFRPAGLSAWEDEMLRIDALMAEGYRIVNSDLVPTAPSWD